MIQRTWKAGLMASIATLLLASIPAKAGLLPISVTVTPESGNHRWTYAIVLPTDMKLQSGNYFTIYDFDGYVAGGENAPEGWSFSSSKIGPTPDRLDPNDNPDLWNLTWTYDGPTVPSGQIGLGNFWAISEYGDAGGSFFTAETNRSSDGSVDRNITDTIVPTGMNPPTPPPEIPEPATLLLAGIGLPLIGVARRYKRNQAAKA